MKPVSADDLLPSELAALMHFYAESGVAWLSEDEPLDRLAESMAPRSRPSPTPSSAEEPVGQGQVPPQRRAGSVEPSVGMPAPRLAVPDVEAVETARRLSGSAVSVEALVEIVESFSECNLRLSARHTVFAAGNISGRILVVGGVPSAEDDREGKPFSGVAGRVIDKMMVGAGFVSGEILLANAIPWRPPGNRAPTAREVEICTPFVRRLIEIVAPEAVLVLGNLAVRILAESPRSGIHALRGRWFDLPGASRQRAFATFHPEELLATPLSKKLAWQDLVRFRAELGGE